MRYNSSIFRLKIISQLLLLLFVVLLLAACNSAAERSGNNTQDPGADSVSTPVDSVFNPDSVGTDSVVAPKPRATIRPTFDDSDDPAPPEASIAYTYKNKMKKGDKELIQVYVQLDKPVEALAANLESTLNEQKAKETGSTDTSIIKSLTITGGKYFLVSIENYDTSVFLIEPVYGDLKQELLFKKPNKWIWRVTAKKEIARAEKIFIIVKSEDAEGKVTESDISILQVEISVNNQPGPVLPPKPRPSFMESYGWLLLIALVVIILALITARWLHKKRLKNLNSRIHFSYAWKNEQETIVDKLYESLKKDGFNVIRDKVNLEYRGLISGFMKDIGKANIIIVCISDKYLKSRFCMFELYEIYRNCGMSKEAFVQKVFPIREEDINLSDAAVIDTYADYWRAAELEQEAIVKDKSQVTTSEQFAQYDAVKRIAQELGNLLNFLSDINSLNIELLSNSDFAELKQSLSAALNNMNKTT